MALEEIDGISAAYVNKEITLYLAEDSYDEDAVSKAIEPFKMAVKSSEKGEMPF